MRRVIAAPAVAKLRQSGSQTDTAHLRNAGPFPVLSKPRSIALVLSPPAEGSTGFHEKKRKGNMGHRETRFQPILASFAAGGLSAIAPDIAGACAITASDGLFSNGNMVSIESVRLRRSGRFHALHGQAKVCSRVFRSLSEGQNANQE